MDFRTIFSDYKQIIAAVVAGIFAIAAAYIRRDKRFEKTSAKKPILSLLLLPLVYLVVGAGLLAVESFSLNLKPKGDLSLDNPGAILCLAGCIFLVAGVAWLPLNLIRLLLWPKPKEQPVLSSPVQADDSLPLTVPLTPHRPDR